MPRISDAQCEELKASINNTIHELVFAAKFIEDDQLEEAAQALMTAQGTLDTVSQVVADAEEA